MQVVLILAAIAVAMTAGPTLPPGYGARQ
jgi:hypothetical protein